MALCMTEGEDRARQKAGKWWPVALCNRSEVDRGGCATLRVTLRVTDKKLDLAALRVALRVAEEEAWSIDSSRVSAHGGRRNPSGRAALCTAEEGNQGGRAALRATEEKGN